MMLGIILCLVAVLGWYSTFVASAVAATQLDPVTVGYASFSGHYTPMWIAVEDGLGKKYGIDLKAVYAGRMRPQQLLMSGDVPIVIATGSGALTSHIVGAKDQVIVANFMNKVGGAIYSKPEIKSPEDLRGKTIGVGRAGSISDSIIRYVLRAKLGLVPDRDVKLLVVGEPALGLQTLERGIVDAAPLNMPLNLSAKKLGFRELVNYEKLGITYPSNTVTTLRQTVVKNPELIERFLKTLIEGLYIFKTQKEKSLAVMRKNLRGAADEILEETYQNTLAEMELVPTPLLSVIRSGLDILSLQYPQAKQTDANAIFDASFVRRIEQSGFFSGLSRR
ncbi:MAG: ABC transporter substrate-binding protein [Deltaproteobacteria bacterium]|nr:ABC transporter substrate-binding protein [Deltaproteobacteria bacterium]